MGIGVDEPGDGIIRIEGSSGNIADVDVNGNFLVAVNSENDFKVKITSNDTTGDFLLAKVIAADESNTTNAIEVKEVNDAGNEDLKIAFDETKITITESQISDLDHNDADAIHDNVSGEINAITEKVSPVNGDWILIEDSEASNAKKKVQAGNLPGGGGGGNVFGNEYQYASSDGQSSTTSGSYQQKVLLTTGSLPSGVYRINFFAEVQNTNDEGGVLARCRLNDTTTIGEHGQETHDDTDNQWVNFSGIYNTGTISGVNTIDIDFKRVQSYGTAYIRKARIEIWRVS